MIDPVLALQLVSTLGMTGIIWYVQLVHYPLFAMADMARFPTFERRHSLATGWVVVPLMLTELVTTLVLLVRSTAGVSRPAAILGAALLIVIWGSTFLIQVPCHRRLEHGFNATAHRRLVRTNWIRTLAWTARALLLIGIMVA